MVQYVPRLCQYINMFSSVDLAIRELQKKKPIIIVDSEERENEGDLVFPADIIDCNIINFMITHCRGIVCLCINKKQAKNLSLELIPKRNDYNNSNVANFAFPIEASTGVTTGISASDRAHTIRVAAGLNASPSDVSTPGHIFPIIGEEKGLSVRQGHTEASMSIIKIAGFSPSSVICEITRDDGEMAKMDDLLIFSKKHNIGIVTIESILQFMKKNDIEFAL